MTRRTVPIAEPPPALGRGERERDRRRAQMTVVVALERARRLFERVEDLLVAGQVEKALREIVMADTDLDLIVRDMMGDSAGVQRLADWVAANDLTSPRPSA